MVRDYAEKPNYFVSVVEDITHKKLLQAEIKENEERLSRLNKELTSKNAELEQVLYATSHDLRSPLVNIQGFNKELDVSLQELSVLLENEEVPETVREKCASILNDDIPESMGFILSSTLKMDALLTGLLTLSRLGRQELNIKKLNMNQIMNEVIAEFGFKIKEKNVNIEISKLPSCKGDKSQINRVFSNLVGNALKFLQSDHHNVISIFGKKEKERILYYVEDNGIGIPADHQKKIFELFHQLDPVKPGRGLGLTIVKQILEKHHGFIRVDSKPGQGSKFIISLPSIKWGIEHETRS